MTNKNAEKGNKHKKKTKVHQVTELEKNKKKVIRKDPTQLFLLLF